jgi:hypothetical protein
MKLFRILGTALLSVALGTSVQAQSFSLSFDDAALFGTPADGSTISGVTFSNSAVDAFILPTSFDCVTLVVCERVIQGMASSTLGFSFGGPVSSLSFGLVRASNAQTQPSSLESYLQLFDVNDNSISTESITMGPLNDPLFGPYFGTTFSWTATGTFAHSAVLHHDFDIDRDVDVYELDNLTGTMATAVPEPTNAGLLAIGLVGIAVARRRRI